MEKKGLIPPGMTYLAENIRQKDNILGTSKDEGAKWAKGLNLPKSKETIFFAGCGYQFDSKLEKMMGLIRTMDKSAVGTDMAMGLAGFQKKLGLDGVFLKVIGGKGSEDGQPLKDAVKILQKLGIDFGYLAEEEPCCGGFLKYMGEQKEFNQHALKVHNTLKTKGVKNIIGVVPSCTYTLRKLMADANGGSEFNVKHLCEVVAENIGKLKLKYPKNVKVTYHDPCQLVRYLNLVEEPRKILKSIQNVEFVETKWTHGQWSTCCGGGGGFESVFPEMSEMLAKNRAKELADTGASIIVTSCPGCIMQIKTGLKAIKAENVEVLDIAQIIAMSMEEA